MSLTLSSQESNVLFALQQGLPFIERPFEPIGRPFGMNEEDVVAFLQRLKAEGHLRRLGAIFDSRRLGYRSCLFAVQVPESRLDAVAETVCRVTGVTHAYIRGWPEGYTAEGTDGKILTAADYAGYPNFWYTLSEHSDRFDAVAAELAAAIAPEVPQPFPALRRFKIDVVFDMRTRSRDEQTEYKPIAHDRPALDESLVETLTQEQINLVRAFQENLPLAPALYTEPAKAAGWDISDALAQLTAWQESGVLRRLAALLYHRKSGFSANGMCCWDVPPEKILEAGRKLAEFPEVTHCYERPVLNGFPFTLYAMIHQQSWDDACAVFRRLTQACDLPTDGRIFFSTREFKKTSVHFF